MNIFLVYVKSAMWRIEFSKFEYQIILTKVARDPFFIRYSLIPVRKPSTALLQPRAHLFIFFRKFKLEFVTVLTL